MNSADSPEWAAFIESLPRETIDQAHRMPDGTYSACTPVNDIGVFRLASKQIIPLVALFAKDDEGACHRCAGSSQLRLVGRCADLPDCNDRVWAPLTPETYTLYIAQKLSGGAG